ncbi:MAG: NAD(P)/FAD-dependent oxidoreductase [Chloroflexi bacterium]|nr:NAD(P)/FAD-dependent oxidoreductase [Chloroflexota bacterium]
MDDRFDFVIIGAGSAGEAAASLARARGASVAVVERALVGGACPFWSCMPSKALLHAAAIHARGGDFDWAAASRWRDEVIERDVAGRPNDAGHVSDLERSGAMLVRGTGRIEGAGRVSVTSDGPPRVLEARFIVIAVGSVPAIPHIDGLDAIDAWTSREATTTRTLPASLAILGAGATGVELAQVFARNGVPTTLIASGPRIYPRGHPRNSAALDATLRADGVEIRTGARATRVRAGAGASGSHAIDLSDGSMAQGHVVLLAVGRTLPLAGLGLETLGIDVAAGPLAVGPDLRIADAVFVAGDVAGPEMHTHLADYQGRMAVRIALGDDARPDYRAVPRAVYTDPEVAGVGLDLEAALAAGHDALEASVSLTDTAKGAVAAATGHVTIVVDRGTRTLLGAFIAGPAATEAIHEAVLAIRTSTTLDVLGDTVHAFPTMARVMGDLIAKTVSDLGAPGAARR